MRIKINKLNISEAFVPQLPRVIGLHSVSFFLEVDACIYSRVFLFACAFASKN